MPVPRAVVEKATRQLVDEGKLVEAGWIGLRMLAIPEAASETQVTEMRNAFFCGAAHVFSSMITMLDPGAEPTDADLSRMSLISDELETFTKTFALRHAATKGNA